MRKPLGIVKCTGCDTKLKVYVKYFECPICKTKGIIEDSEDIPDVQKNPSLKKSIFKNDQKIKFKSESAINKIALKKTHNNFAHPNNNATDNQIRIHVFNNEKLNSILQNSIDRLRLDYPSVILENENFNSFIKKVFPSSLGQECIVTNHSFINAYGNISRRVSIKNLSSTYLKKRLPKGTLLTFFGKLVDGEFVVEEIKSIENLKIKKDDYHKKYEFYFDGPKKANCLYEITNTIAKNAEDMGEKLTSWYEYLDWKKHLAEKRIKGIKYIAVDTELDNRLMIFLAVSPSKNEFIAYKKALFKNEMSVFSNAYSVERLKFEFKHDVNDSNDYEIGLPLQFLEIRNQYNLSDKANYSEWETHKEYTKVDKSINRYESINSTVLDILALYPEAYVAEIVFDISFNASVYIENNIKHTGMISDELYRPILGEFYSEGFIAASQIGDFALINRLKKAMYDLASGRCVSQNLDEWIFDINVARKPDEIERISEWQNVNMNNEQKLAVEKILSAPDVCLIQGPPGTGKTTVIAEAIYQFVIRKKRVLVTSQANLAVDNALERLISDPNVRAIRLGNNRKIDSSVNNITEQNVLKSFYDSIINLVNTEYLNEWVKIDREANKIDLEIEKLKEAQEKSLDLEKEIENIIKKLLIEEKKYNNFLEGEDERYAILNSHRSETQNIRVLLECCRGNFLNDDFMLQKNTVAKIYVSINDILQELASLGIIFTKAKIDFSKLDLPSKLASANDVLLRIVKGIYRLKAISIVSNKPLEKDESNLIIDELKLRQGILKEKILSGNLESYNEYAEVTEKINKMDCNSNNKEILEDDLSLLDDETIKKINTSVDKKMCLQNLINKSNSLLNKLIENINKSCEIIIAAYENEKNDIVNDYERIKYNIDIYKQDLNKIKDKKRTVSEYIDKISKKYNCSIDEIINTVEDRRIDSILEQDKTVIRSKWEDLFNELNKWIEGIPDYIQENEMYLTSYINGCNVVGVSCTENSRTLTEKGFDDFDVVIIDEISKVTPPEMLIPLVKGKKAILVGDHRQLPPLFNEHEKSYAEAINLQDENQEEIALTLDDFDKYKDMVTSSLFQEHFENAHENIKQSLLQQYRMHDDIMDIINNFYDGKLLSGFKQKDNPKFKAHSLSIDSIYGIEMINPDKHAYWFDSSTLRGKRFYEHRKAGSTSAENILECYMILEILKKIEKKYSMEAREVPIMVGVISFYFDQVKTIRQLIKNEVFRAIDIEVNTVDRFQGKEKEIILVSLVRNIKSEYRNTNSHIAAFQRINVAFSRAQNLLLIFGAKDMYANQPVILRDMDNGNEKTTYIYKNIIEMLDMKGCFYSSDDIIHEKLADEIQLEVLNRGSDNR